jgi:ATP-dependent Clp protease adapter protein ClpS
MSQKTLEKPRIGQTEDAAASVVEGDPAQRRFHAREFVVLVLKAVFRMNESHAYKV